MLSNDKKREKRKKEKIRAYCSERLFSFIQTLNFVEFSFNSIIANGMNFHRETVYLFTDFLFQTLI